MNPNPRNNSNKEVDLAVSRLMEMMEKQALYERIAAINEEMKGADEEEIVAPPVSIVAKPSKKIYLKWAAIAASLIIGGLLFLFKAKTAPPEQLALTKTTFRNIEYTRSRSAVSSEEVQTVFTDIDDLIESGDLESADELLKELDKKEEQVGKIYREGILAYLSNDFTLAADAFSKIVKIENKEYIEDAYWNLLLSHKKANNLTKAMEVAKEMQSNKHITKKQKKAALHLVEN